MLNTKLLAEIIDRYKAAMFTVDRRLGSLLREVMPADLTLDQFSTIQYIRTRGSCTSSELADVFCVGKSSITAIVNRLFDKGFIKRLPDEKDRRVTVLELTEEGMEMAALLDGKIQELLTRYIGHFEEKEAVQFIEMYEKLARVLSQPAPPDEGEGNQG